MSMSPNSVQEWTNKKLVEEVRKQIRRDHGGVSLENFYRDKIIGIYANEGDIPPDSLLKLLVSFVLDMTSRVQKGSQSRILGKLNEILRRLEEKKNGPCSARLVRCQADRKKLLELLRNSPVELSDSDKRVVSDIQFDIAIVDNFILHSLDTSLRP